MYQMLRDIFSEIVVLMERAACLVSLAADFFLLARSDRAWRLLLNTLDAVGQPRTGQTRGGGWEPLARGLAV